MSAGTRRRVEADNHMYGVNKEWKCKSVAVLSELSDVCGARIPGEKKRIQAARRPWKTPKAQCSLEILPAAIEGEGILRVEVRH